MRKMLIVVLILAMALVGCAPRGGPADDGRILIGFSQVTMASPFYVSLVEGARNRAAELGVELLVVDANEDVVKQNQDIADMLELGIKVLILNPVDADGAAPSLAAAAARGVPVITIDRFVNAPVAAVIGRDNVTMGEAVGVAVVEFLGGRGNARGKILEVMGAAGCQVMEARSRGFRQVVDRESGIVVVQTPHCDYVRSKAATATQDIIQAHRDIALIYGHNDDMALGALQVCLDAGMNVMAAGVDGLIEAVEAIMRGQRYLATSANDPMAFGIIGVDTAVKLARGEQVPREIDAGTFLIDASNAQRYFNPSLVFAVGN